MERTKKPLPVHYTSHACLVADPTASAPDKGLQVYGPDGVWGVRSPIWIGCRSNRDRPLLPHRHHYSTHPDDVTCPRCLALVVRLQLVAERPRRDSEIEDTPILRKLDAHRLCCAARGAPSPLTAAETLQIELDRLGKEAKRIVGIDVMPCAALMRSVTDKESAATWFRDKLAELAETADPRVCELAQPLFHRWMFVGDLLVHVDEAIREAKALVEPFMLAVRALAPDNVTEGN